MAIRAEKVYLIGIGGIGMSALARLFLSMGKKVSGSDLRESKVTSDLKQLGAAVFIGHNPSHLANKPEIVIYSQDITVDSLGFVELEAAKEQGIETISYAKALGMLMEGKFGIGVTGTNGKSTTAAFLGLILEAAGLDPTVLLGTQIKPENQSEKFQANARLGNSEYFVAEVDEYYRKMLETKPKMIVLTNIAEDHLDYYSNLADIKSAFLKYILSLPNDGVVVYNADDHNTVEVAREAICHKLTFGIHHYADLQALNIEIASQKQSFDLHYKDQLIGKFALQVPGLFNISNALGASLAALQLGIDKQVIKKVLAEFRGSWRRFEQVGLLSGKVVISDYAHHPAAVAATLAAAKEFYPNKKILVVFQPHHHNRTKKLFDQFVDSLLKVDEVILSEIYDVAGREHGEQISSQELVDALTKQGVRAFFSPDLSSAEKLILEKIKDFDVVLMMGAGDIDTLAREIVS